MNDTDELEATVRSALHELYPEPTQVRLWPAVWLGVRRHRHRRRVGIGLAIAAAVVLAVVLPTTLLNSGSPTGRSTHVGGAGACKAVLNFRAGEYWGGSLNTPSRPNQIGQVPRAHMHSIGIGTIPPCKDTNHSQDVTRRVAIARIEGVNPRVAVADYDTGDVYARNGAQPPKRLVKEPWIRWVTP